MNNNSPTRVIAVTSGKGGVGKTNVSVNMAVAMAMSGKKVMLMDADLGLANVDILLGLQAQRNLSHVISGECTLQDIIVDGPHGIKIVPAASGTERMADLLPSEHAGLIQSFSELQDDLDVLLIDTAAGISNSVISFTRAAQEVVVVVCDEPTSITDAYAVFKLLSREYGLYRFRVIANMVRTSQEGHDLFNKLSRVTDRFLDVALDFMGSIPFDENLRKSVQRQRAVVDLSPRSKSAVAINNIVQKVDKWPTPASAGGHLEFFVERLIQSNQQLAGRSF